jgi:site-specific recombinase XerD
MASLVKRGKVWYCYYRIDGRQFGVTTYQVGRAPNDVARQILEKYRQMEGCNKHGLPYVDTAASVSDLIGSYWESKPSLTLHTAKKKKSMLDTLTQFMGGKKVTSIGVPECDQFFSTCLTHLHDNSKELYRAVISSIWAWGMKRSFATKNPWSEIAFKRAPKTPRRCLKQHEIDSLIQNAKGSALLAIMLGLYAGARVGDCVNLYGEDIDFATKTITFRRRKGSREGSPKVQEIPLHPILEEVLSKIPLVSNLPLIPHKKTYLGIKVANAMKEAGVNATHHYLRHTFISNMAEKQAGMAQISQLAGHSSWNITKRYTHISQDSLRETIGVLQ